jgi:Fur family transcriptional regulator, ferric uptake regulator
MLRERGLRLTPQREIVLKVLHDIDGLTTAEEIFENVNAINPTLDISTVYRTLDLLEDLGMLSSSDLGDGQRRYELVGVHQPHHYMLCTQCQQLVRIDPAELDELLSHFRQTHGFTVETHSITFRGLCKKCNAVKNK